MIVTVDSEVLDINHNTLNLILKAINKNRTKIEARMDLGNISDKMLNGWIRKHNIELINGAWKQKFPAPLTMQGEQ